MLLDNFLTFTLIIVSVRMSIKQANLLNLDAKTICESLQKYQGKEIKRLDG